MHPQLSLSLGTSSQKWAQPFTPEGLSPLLFPGPSQALSSFPGTSATCPGLITVPLVPQPEDLEAPKTHHFKVKTFKKVKPCGICRQVITREGCTCKGEQLVGPGHLGARPHGNETAWGQVLIWEGVLSSVDGKPAVCVCGWHMAGEGYHGNAM